MDLRNQYLHYQWCQMDDVEKFLSQSGFLPTTIEGYRRLLQYFDGFLQSYGIGIERAGPEVLLNFMERRQWGEAARHKCSAAIRSYVRWKYGEAHPILSLKLRRPPIKPHRTLTAAQVRLLLDSFDLERPAGLRDYAIVMLMVETGLRKAEVARLELAYVNLEARKLDVLVKGGHWGSGYFSEETASSLDDWLSIRGIYAKPETKGFFCAVGGHHAGQSLTTNGVGMIFKTMSRRVGFPVSAHDLRRTMATLLTLSGAPTEVVCKAGRWHNLEQVRTYTQAVQASAVMKYLPMPNLNRLVHGD
ncbi:MAG: tyrosine-type recombinase/integrase [Anaerolineaceae bacterium]|nr:tyrosine-type recombinase/integrase [Anaerolineaceae bacterium]MDD5367541.1 tyrosine-type recombinase/integrase [Anaerolineaceae bacterium]